MTEDEAKTKWCPMVRVCEGDSTENRNCKGGIVSKSPGEGVQWNCCIASACMMWREADRVEDPEKFGNYLPIGYCGLAGKL